MTINNLMKVVDEIPICDLVSEYPSIFCDVLLGLCDMSDGGDIDGKRLA